MKKIGVLLFWFGSSVLSTTIATKAILYTITEIPATKNIVEVSSYKEYK